ncbi:hypothetical protein SCHPADRAFT_692771 [Schizopora paradoxa]|uniref:Uncharacterized protein n=1 Tax=Schizopora paradoxa TaxID=27342 RepID=A0A0H2R4S4_9AGAM|nr:hypothetical protein SCHPADRAFT_692771 [Schizopora paradoxa]
MDASSLYSHSNSNMSFHLLRLNTDIEPVAFPYPWNKVKRGPSATTPSRRTRSRAPSIWSTSSICSDDSLAESSSDEETEPESLFSAPSPTTTSTTSSSWCSARSSCADPYNMYNDGASLLSAPPSPVDARFPRAGEKPRGPRSRPLPTLPTHRPSSSGSPTSPLASNSPITASRTFSSLAESAEQQQQPVVVVSAPREPEPKPSSKRVHRKHAEQMSFEHSLRIASHEDYIDWDRIEDIMCYSDG